MHYYRVLTEFEESRYERMMVDLGLRVFARKLPIPEVPVRFITPSYAGELQEEKPILGLARGRREIYLLAGLADHELISTLAHEARHIFQVVTGRYCLDMETRERDARLWALELNSPRTGPEIRRWLWLKKLSTKNPNFASPSVSSTNSWPGANHPYKQPLKSAESNTPAPEGIASQQAKKSALVTFAACLRSSLRPQLIKGSARDWPKS